MNPIKLHLQITTALMLLLAATVGLAYVDLGPLNTAAAMSISLAKAALIIIVFMRLREASGLIRVAMAAGFFWLGILFLLSLSDYFTRTIQH